MLRQDVESDIYTYCRSEGFLHEYHRKAVEQMYVYVVAVSHTLPGKAVAVALVTNSLEKAVTTIRQIEDLDYQFDVIDITGAVIYKLEMERTYAKDEFSFRNQESSMFPIIMTRIKEETGWREEWSDESAKRVFART